MSEGQSFGDAQRPVLLEYDIAGRKFELYVNSTDAAADGAFLAHLKFLSASLDRCAVLCCSSTAVFLQVAVADAQYAFAGAYIFQEVVLNNEYLRHGIELHPGVRLYAVQP